MSLYSLATDLFEDIDKVRAGAPDPTISAKTQPRLVDDDDEPDDRLWIKVNSEVQLPQLAAWRQNGKNEQTPTLELLEGCLHDIHEIRCGARPTPMTEAKHSRSEGQSWQLDDSDRTSSSCSQTSRTGGELIDQDNDADGGTGTLDPATEGGVCVVARGGDTKATVDSFVGVPAVKTWYSSRGQNAGAGPAITATRASTIVHESGPIDEPWGHASPRLLSNDMYSATDQCAEKLCSVGPDAAATESYADFEHEVTEWSTSARVGGGQRARTDMAAYLSSKYLCRKLDAIPSSTVVCQLRQEVVQRTELLATGKDQQVDGAEKQLTTSRPHSGHDDLGVNDDEDHQAMDHRANGNVSPPPVNGRTIPAVLASRVTQYRDPTANQVSVDCVDGDPTWQVRRSIQAGRKFPGMKDVSPDSSSSRELSELSRISASNFGELYTTAKRLAVGGLGAGGRVTGEATSCLKRVAQKLPPVSVDKGGISSSTSAGRPRARAVRFLLGSDDGESRPPSAGVVNESPARTEMAKLEAANPANIDGFWTCIVCGKANEKGGVSCTICGKRQQHRGCVVKAHLGIRTEEKYPAVVRGGPNKVQQQPEHRQETARLIPSGDSVRSDRKTGKRLGGGSGIGGMRDTTRNFSGPYDASSFAKMRKETEPAVRARLGLTGEIKSLLSAIRRNG